VDPHASAGPVEDRPAVAPPATRRGLRGLLGLLLALALCFGAAASGALFPPGEWYLGLERPALTPPSWVFGPAWTSLYVLMAVAAWLVWRERGLVGARGPLALFALQLALNAVWSALFFGAHAMGWALVEIVALWLCIAATALAFRRVKPLAATLLVPYLLWVAFATWLNLGFWRLNG
jgi:tryptophan-rich sensory protein